VFDNNIKAAKTPLSEHATVQIVDCSSAVITSALENGGTANYLSQIPKCDPVTSSWSLKSIEIASNSLQVQLAVSETIEKKTLLIRFDSPYFLQSKLKAKTSYPKSYLILEDISVIKSKFDGMMESAATPTKASIALLQLFLMSISLPQAFILMKLLQTLDYYVYINCEFPSNFSAFLQIVASSALDYVPNMFVSLDDGEGSPVYDRFVEFGLNVGIFSNLGKMYTMLFGMSVVKLVTKSLTLFKCKNRQVGRKLDKVDGAVSPELFFGIMESHHLDCVIALIIFIAQRDRVNDRSSLLKYIVILFVSLFSLFMVSMYLFMGYTVSRLTKAYFQYGLLEVKDMKDEDWRFLIEDKNMRGNIFQRHFNLIQLIKDILFAVLLYILYYQPLALIIMISLTQAVMLTGIFLYPPYNKPLLNRSLKTTNIFYMMLNILFVTLIGFGNTMSPSTKYFFIGFSMIGVVMCILACNIGFGLYSTIGDLMRRYKRRREKKLEQEMISAFTNSKNKSSLTSKGKEDIGSGVNSSIHRRIVPSKKVAHLKENDNLSTPNNVFGDNDEPKPSGDAPAKGTTNDLHGKQGKVNKIVSRTHPKSSLKNTKTDGCMKNEEVSEKDPESSKLVIGGQQIPRIRRKLRPRIEARNKAIQPGQSKDTGSPISKKTKSGC